jgi:hypothetical protein
MVFPKMLKLHNYYNETNQISSKNHIPQPYHTIMEFTRYMNTNN